MEAIGYFRHSGGAPRDESSSSLEEQETAFFRYCQEQGFHPVATFIDSQLRGLEGSRGYRQLVEYLRQPGRGFTVVVVGRVQDLAPIPREAVRGLVELEYLGAQVVCLETGAATGDLLEEAVALWRRHRSQDPQRERALDTLRNKAMHGFGLGKPPYGYRIGAQGRLEVMPEEARVVEQIYRMYVEQKRGLRLIARHLNDTAIPTRRGSRWSVVTVRDVLRNRAYVGTYVRYGVRVPGSHEAIIGQELFRLAQQQREAKGGGRPPGRETAFALSGLAHCGQCGGRMIGVSRRQRWFRKRDGGYTEMEYRYYRCGSRVNQSVCGYHTRRADALEQAVLAAMEQKLAAEAPASPPEPSQRDSSTTLKSRLRNLDARLERYLDGAARGSITLKALRTAVFPTLREARRLELRLQQLESLPERQTTHGVLRDQRRASLMELQQRWPRLSSADQRLALGDLLERVIVFDDRVEPAFSS